MSAATPEQAGAFANHWIAAWNAHDLDRVLAHYADGFEVRSPVIITVTGEPSGKVAVADYRRHALALRIDRSVAVGRQPHDFVPPPAWRAGGGLHFFNAAGLVERAAAHYGDASAAPE